MANKTYDGPPEMGLKPGYEGDYAGRPAVHAVAGLGRIVKCERMATGRFNILLKGEMRVRIEDIGDGRTRMSIENLFPSAEAMEQVLAMGQEEGMKQAVGQIDAILAEMAVRSA